ncbi:MAG: hypothetical protein K2H63_08020 [Paramuribaculum sp.]|nr:hypothetical protein [Paramuribaculum sp.]
MIYIFNTLLIIITIVCLYAIGYIGLDWFVPIGSADNPERINTVLINLSYSYIAGLIFYLLTTSLPRYVFAHKMRKPLQSKAETMLGKIEDSAKCAFSMPTWNSLIITEDGLKNQFSSIPLCATPCAYAITGAPAISIIEHQKIQRNEILQIAKEILEYKEYLTPKQLGLIEKIREANYFHLLNAFAIPIFDQPQNREALAKELYKTLQDAKELNNTFS